MPAISVLFWLHTSSPRPSAWPQSLSRALHPQYLVPFTCQSASPEQHHYYYSTHDGQKYPRQNKTHIDTVRSCRNHGRSRSPRPPCTCPPARCCQAPPWNTGTALLHNILDSFGSSKEFLTLLFDTVTRSAHIHSLLVFVVCADAAVEGVSAAPAAVTFAHRG